MDESAGRTARLATGTNCDAPFNNADPRSGMAPKSGSQRVASGTDADQLRDQTNCRSTRAGGD